ncbi:Protein of unknown function [Filimonas lacunae]|uniref:DUF3606 domain-containing protein n=1 Tax=Filimonas lacunae TaxID=477680 RepID=A0A1N7R5C7_9BACT|nr:DUF3606 domain-containing protein [Filimonas lacunae]SIT30348.1 Protein of unknown function [Filimonas lacunae]
MSDSKVNIGKQDRLRVDSKDRSEVEYLHMQFPWLQHKQIKDAIKSVGPFRKNIERYLSDIRK